MSPDKTRRNTASLRLPAAPPSPGSPVASAAGEQAPASHRASPQVAILLCTYRGEDHLALQLESFARQTHTNWRVWASDDGSDDATLAILEACSRQWAPGRLNVRAGPRAGVARNFLHLACLDSLDEEAEFFAYSDQDDVWESDKLERALRYLQSAPAGTPALYCSRTRLVDENGTEIGLSPLFVRQPSFANALVQNIAGGNTMVFNRPALELIRAAGESVPVAFHDWWAYLVVTGCGGQVFYDDYPSLRYRQHQANQLGSNVTWRAKLVRIQGLWHGRFRCWNDGNIVALRTLAARLTPESRALLERFARARDRPLLPRLIELRKCGIYRQTPLGNLGLFVAALLKKV